ncbi:hypothetical protein FUSNEC_GEN_300_09370 [Fusobacterium necrophorum subsp. funduliforme]|uniref:hypothetical protein n=2 Tax=Fusobacterium necrophorum TaxID=859 RepID=UPI00101368B2|nr:hypothetical protein [Fusobacterium necrophorum]RXZ26900.1 hypothetical protein EPT55_07710 [Fusobacterium necrophorum]
MLLNFLKIISDLIGNKGGTMKTIRAFTALENQENHQAEYRILRDEEKYQVECLVRGKWSLEDTVYGEENFEKYIKEWETTQEEWGI